MNDNAKKQPIHTGFQQRLQKMVQNRIFVLVGTGIALFIAGIYLFLIMSNRRNLEENRSLFESVFQNVYSQGADFLRGEDLNSFCQSCLLYDADPAGLQYLLYEFNAVSPLSAELILTDKGRNIIFNSFQAGEWNQYRSSFNRAICDSTYEQKDGDVHLSVYYLSGSYSELVLSRPVFLDGMIQGYLNLYFPGEGWVSLLSLSNFEGVITDRIGRVIYSSRQSFIEDINRFSPPIQEGILSLGGERYEISGSTLLDGRVRIYSLLYDPQNNWLFLIGSGIILFLGISWFWMAQEMSRAMAESNAATVKKLVEEMDIIVTKDSAHRICMDTDDEFADVGLKINHMLDSIQELNRHNTELLELRRIAEINQLTAQLNPHFLYNTLENLRSEIIFDPETVDKLIMKLVGILRYSIDDHQEEVIFREDMRYLNSYLDIQKYRYGERFCYHLSLEDDCLDCLVPKLVLQPIVENSIKYGFRSKMNLHIWIDGYVQDNMLHLSVTDDGVGMTPEDADILNASLKQECATTHKGLYNIARRLYLQHGESSGLQVRCLDPEGLQVIVDVAQPLKPVAAAAQPETK